MSPTHSVFVLLMIALFATMGCASSSTVETRARRPPIPIEQVTLYFQEPAEFEVVAPISASSGERWNDQRSVEYALKQLKKQAADLGANGLLLDLEIDTTTSIDNSYKRTIAKTVRGTAIFVKSR